MKHETTIAKPFVKWAGGKTQLISTIQQSIPKELASTSFTYIEPFVGGGAVLFWMLNKYPNLKKVVINDINEDLINTYRTIAAKPKELIKVLSKMQKEYHQLEKDKETQKLYYYTKRELYNKRSANKVMQAGLFIFLNRTCFNGLYRVNASNGFNVPMGSYKKPMICDVENIMAVSKALKKVEILCGDFEQTLTHATKNTFFYFDPPYKPLHQTASFTAYAKGDFNDDEQIRLGNFCKQLDASGHKWILSNSDVKDKVSNNTFFDDLFAPFKITRVKAKRIINANPDKRGELNELLITNYRHEQTLQTA